LLELPVLFKGFREPSDAVLAGSNVYIIEHGGKAGNIWKITLPTGIKQASKK
jgi:hypothetical protein